MIDIVAIHGISQHRSSRRKMQTAWLEAIREGLHDIRSPHADSVTLECAFYGHEYNDGKSIAEPPYSAIDLEAGFEIDLVMAIAAALSDGDSPADEEEVKVYLPSALQRALTVIQDSALFERLDSVLISFVKQVHRYLADSEFHDKVLDEFSKAMTSSPRLVIGHSLGSVVAYDWLRTHRSDDRPALLTLGSPLGFAAIRRTLGQSPDRSRWPDGASSWTNIAAGHDPVAMVKELAPLYHPDINDQPCTNPRRSAHSALCYLQNVQVARAIDKAIS